MPDKLAEMKQKFDKAAEEFHVYPFDDRGSGRLAIPKPPAPGDDPNSTTHTYYAGATRIAKPAAPPMKNRSWTITAKVSTRGSETEGVILGFGDVAAGLVLYVEKGVPIFDYNFFEEHTVAKGDNPLAFG